MYVWFISFIGSRSRLVSEQCQSSDYTVYFRNLLAQLWSHWLTAVSFYRRLRLIVRNIVFRRCGRAITQSNENFSCAGCRPCCYCLWYCFYHAGCTKAAGDQRAKVTAAFA